ncbi:MAG: SDR family NAD(P)-dependent oxidoreductase [Adhaeribacter sp.]
MSNNPFSLQHKVILVTGGYGFLGSAICTGLIENEATVVVLGREETRFREAFPQAPERLHFLPADISDTASLQASFQAAHQRHGRIDGLINNAFFSKGNQPLAISDEDLSFTLEGNLGSVYRCIREVVPYLQEKGGRIINVSSMYGMVSPDFQVYEGLAQFLNPPHYGAAKAGVMQLTRYFACYLGKDKILVNTVTPGPFPNETVQQNQEFISRLGQKTPLGRIGRPEELKGIFAFLCSDQASYITGQNFIVDGGWTAW